MSARSYDYTGYSDASRASIQMTHLANGPLVSLEEAQRIEQETAQHLYSSRKLSLIVDLDQTIVHATVDPTVGEWIAEGEAWEARQAKKASGTEEKETEPGEEDADDEVNPNWEALKDVKKFRLGPEALGQPHQRNKGKGKEKLIEQEGCMYYIKPRYVHMRSVHRGSSDAAAVPACWSSCRPWPPSMRCTFIPWVRVLTQRKSAPLSTRTARSSVIESSVETRAEVSFALPPSRAVALTCTHEV